MYILIAVNLECAAVLSCIHVCMWVLQSESILDKGGAARVLFTAGGLLRTLEAGQ